MRYLDGVLATQPYLAGGSFSIADITAFAGLAFADFAKIDVPADLGEAASLACPDRRASEHRARLTKERRAEFNVSRP